MSIKVEIDNLIDELEKSDMKLSRISSLSNILMEISFEKLKYEQKDISMMIDLINEEIKNYMEEKNKITKDLMSIVGNNEIK